MKVFGLGNEFEILNPSTNLLAYHFNFFSSIFSIVDVDKLAARIEDEVARKEGSLGIVQIWHLVSE